MTTTPMTFQRNSLPLERGGLAWLLRATGKGAPGVSIRRESRSPELAPLVFLPGLAAAAVAFAGAAPGPAPRVRQMRQSFWGKPWAQLGTDHED